MGRKKTRLACSHSHFGAPLAVIPKNQLPSFGTVAKHFLFLKQSKFQYNRDVAPKLAKLVIEIWQLANLPTQSFNAVTRKITRLMGQGSVASKNKRSYGNYDRLFDICSCSCVRFDACKCKVPVPSPERTFLSDQRLHRKMFIGDVDKHATGQLQRRKDREERLELKKQSDFEKTQVNNIEIFNEEETQSEFETKSDSSFEAPNLNESRNSKKIQRIALEADRYNVSNRAAAAIATATLIDFDVISRTSLTNVVDHHKVWRARKKLRTNLSEETSHNNNIQAIFFDGRKDQTLVKTKQFDKWYSKKEIEDHYVFVGEPGTQYLCHSTVEKGTGKSIGNEIRNLINDLEQSSQIVALGSDSTAVNTGKYSGAICTVEKELQKPLHWIICYLHLNELPLRHLCQKLIGESDGPGLMKGEIGKALICCEKVPLASNGFKPIPKVTEMPIVDPEVLSHDQLYLYMIIESIKKQSFSNDFLNKKPGPMSKARWITTANRLCRLYITTSEPPENLYLVVHFIVNFYGPMWFFIKTKPYFENGSQHLCQQIRLLKTFSEVIVNTVWPVVKRNAYWAQSENALIALLADDDKTNRKFAVDQILTLRQRQNNVTSSVRQFLVPDINPSMVDVKQFIAFDQQCFEPPYTMSMTTEELNSFIDHPLRTAIPCHSQGVERCVKVVTEASSEVFGADARDGFIRAKIKSRSIVPSFRSKVDYFV